MAELSLSSLGSNATQYQHQQIPKADFAFRLEAGCLTDRQSTTASDVWVRGKQSFKPSLEQAPNVSEPGVLEVGPARFENASIRRCPHSHGQSTTSFVEKRWTLISLLAKMLSRNKWGLVAGSTFTRIMPADIAPPIGRR